MSVWDSKLRVARWATVLAVGCGGIAHSSDIYRAVAPDGTHRFASAPLNQNYTLYLRAETSPLKLRSSKAAGSKSIRPDLLEAVIRLSDKHGVDPNLVRAVIAVESNFDAGAVSPKGAAGLMQLMPATAARYGVRDRADPLQNAEAGIRYLKDLLVLHRGNVPLALASYNAGEGAIARYGKRIPPYRETMLYVPAVLAHMYGGEKNKRGDK